MDNLFDGSTEETNLALACIVALPMKQHRSIFVMLRGMELGSGDVMVAYSQSVNLVISHAKTLSCCPALEQCVAAHECAYRDFRAIRQELGKD